MNACACALLSLHTSVFVCVYVCVCISEVWMCVCGGEVCVHVFTYCAEVSASNEPSSAAVLYQQDKT